MNTSNAQKEIQIVDDQIQRKPRAYRSKSFCDYGPNWIWVEKTYTLKWDPERARRWEKKTQSQSAHRKRDKQQKRARDSARKFKAFKLKEAHHAGRHTYALFD